MPNVDEGSGQMKTNMSLGFGNMEVLNDLDESSYKEEAEARLDLEEV